MTEPGKTLKANSTSVALQPSLSPEKLGKKILHAHASALEAHDDMQSITRRFQSQHKLD